MNDLKFLKGSSSDYISVDPKVETTFYYTIDDGKLYLGEHELTTPSKVTEAIDKVATNSQEIEKLKQKIFTLVGGEEGQTIHDMIEEVVQAAIDTEHEQYVGNKQDLATLNKETLVGAINEVKTDIDNTNTAIDTAKEELKVTIEKDTATEGVAARYTFKQNNIALENGVIDIPKDMVVSSGEVKVITQEQIEEGGDYYEKVTEPGTYIILTISNDKNDQLFIKVDTLVDIYKAATSEEKTKEIIVTVDNNSREISATIKENAITEEKIADDAVTSNKIADNAVDSSKIADSSITADKIAEGAVTAQAINDEAITSNKLDSTSQENLTKASTALQSEDISEGTGENGTFNVKGTSIAIHGLKDLAYKNEADLNLNQYALVENALTVTDITEKATEDGAISVKGSDVKVKGLKSLAYKDEEDLSLTDYAKKADIKESTVDGNIAVGEENVPVHNLNRMITAGAEAVVNEKFVWKEIA